MPAPPTTWVGALEAAAQKAKRTDEPVTIRDANGVQRFVVCSCGTVSSRGESHCGWCKRRIDQKGNP